MKYFAKYLPVEGKIKKGDYIIDSLGVRKVETKQGLQALESASHIKKVKPFLCSRDIQVGDKVYREKLEDWEVFDKEPEHTNHGSWGFLSEVKPSDFKVIGEISPEATWVKEGDEFDEEDWRFVTYADDINPILLDKTKQWDRKKYPVNLEIKDPCGHFH